MLAFDIKTPHSLGGGLGMTQLPSTYAATNALVSATGNAIVPGLGSLLGGLNIASWFGNYTSAEAFMQDGPNKLAAIMKNFSSLWKTNPSFALTQLSKDLNFTLMESEVNLSNSTSTRSKNGNANSVKVFRKALADFDTMITELKKSHVVETTPKTSPFKSNGTYNYNSYKLTAKSTEPTKKVNIPVNTTTTTGGSKSEDNSDDDKNIYGSPWYVVAIVSVVGGVIALGAWVYKKFKNRKKKKR